MIELPPTLRDLLALGARLLIGAVLLAHGWQKLVGQGLGATSAAFARLGVPVPGLSATFAACVETGGGILPAAGPPTRGAGRARDGRCRTNGSAASPATAAGECSA